MKIKTFILILLNIFLLSISFLIFKYFLLNECIALSNFLSFDFDGNTSKIAVEIVFSDSYTPYPEGQYKIFLTQSGYREQLGFLTTDWKNFSVHMLFYLYWLSCATEYLPFLDVTLIIY